jgi:hypothetical protein
MSIAADAKAVGVRALAGWSVDQLENLSLSLNVHKRGSRCLDVPKVAVS